MKRILLALALTMLLSLGCGRQQDLVPDGLHFHSAIEASNAATRLTNQFTVSSETPSIREREEILRYTRVALEHARLVSDRGLARMHDDMPRVFHDRFVRGLETVADGLERRDPRAMADGHLHLDKWADWLEAHAREVRFPPRPPATEGSR